MMMGAAEPGELRGTLEAWAKKAVDDHGAEAACLFGSLFYKHSAEFIAGSVADLVVVTPMLASAVERWRCLVRFAVCVGGLQANLIRLL